MLTSNQTDQLWPAILRARADMKPAFKGKENLFHKYKYANEEAWHDAVIPRLQAEGLVLTFSLAEYVREGSLTRVKGTARITHAASAQWLEVDGYGEGEDKTDKAVYKATTGLKKYLYALAFALPTTDDPEDSAHDQQRAAEEIKAKVPANSTPAEINGALVAAGLEPQHDEGTKVAARIAWKELQAIDKDRANGIKHKWGTDYAKMLNEFRTVLHELQEKA